MNLVCKIGYINLKDAVLQAFRGTQFEHLRAKKVNLEGQFSAFHILGPLHDTYLHSYCTLMHPLSCLLGYTFLHCQGNFWQMKCFPVIAYKTKNCHSFYICC